MQKANKYYRDDGEWTVWPRSPLRFSLGHSSQDLFPERLKGRKDIGLVGSIRGQKGMGPSRRGTRITATTSQIPRERRTPTRNSRGPTATTDRSNQRTTATTGPGNHQSVRRRTTAPATRRRRIHSVGRTAIDLRTRYWLLEQGSTEPNTTKKRKGSSRYGRR